MATSITSTVKPSGDFALIVPSDFTDLVPTPKNIKVLTDGDINIVGTEGGDVIIPVIAGEVLNLLVKQVRATGTTATLLALY